MKYYFKDAYKIIKNIERRRSRQRRYNTCKLINMLINIKSNNINIYEGEDRNQLVMILRNRKTWNGDVRNYFKDYYDRFFDWPNLKCDHFWNQYKDTALQDGLPF